MPKRVETLIDGQRQVHMIGGPNDYDTACGIDMNDPAIGNHPGNINNTVHLIDCPACIRIWQDARLYKRKDFIK